MSSQEETKEWFHKLWNIVWSDLSNLPSVFTQDAEMTTFTPPKLTTWKGIADMKQHFEEIKPIISSTSFEILRIDLVEGTQGQTFYAAYEGSFLVKMPGQEEHVMHSNGVAYCVRENEADGAKAKILTFYEDATPFVEMAMGGAFK